MPSIRETAVSAGLRANRRISGSPVVYTRGASSLGIMHAVKRTDEFTTLDQSGAESIIVSTVWRMAVAELGAIGEPAVGDTITDEIGTVYRVDSPGAGILHWTSTDVGNTELTIYSREVGDHRINGPTQRDLAGNEVSRP